MTTSKTLRLKKPLDFEQQARLSQALGHSFLKEPATKESADNKNNKSVIDKTKGKAEENLFAETRTRIHLKKKALGEAIDWLCTTYPNCFSKEDPKPLSVGIFKDILLRGNWPHSKTFLSSTLKFYTKSTTYQKAIIELERRYLLNGDLSQEITDFEKESAIKKLQLLEELKKGKENNTES